MKHLPSTLAAVTAGALLLAPAAEARKETVKLSRGATELTLASGVVSALQAAGVSTSAASPATATSGGALRFPITKGRLSSATEGTVDHVGGLELAKGDTRVVVRNLRITLDEDGSTLTGKVGGRRVEVAELDTSGAQVSTAGRAVTITGVDVLLAGPAATALNEAFGTTFAAGDELGTVTLAARLNGRLAKAAKAPKTPKAPKAPTAPDHGDDGAEDGRDREDDGDRGRGRGRGRDD